MQSGKSSMGLKLDISLHCLTNPSWSVSMQLNTSSTLCSFILGVAREPTSS